jgi:AmmeMemoRadiSam system protein B
VSTRPPARAGVFYPASAADCEAGISDCLSRASLLPDAGESAVAGPAIGGIVPHAGWVYSGPTAARTLLALGAPPIRCIVVFGAVHSAGVPRAQVSASAAWETPLGPVSVDADLRDLVREELDVGESAHRAEHSIEVHVPFIRRLHPDAAILPVAMPPDDAALEVGAVVARAAGRLEGRVVYLGSTDLTHYGPRFYGFAPHGRGPEAHRWSKENDRAFLDRLVALDPAGALADSRRHRNACGAGAAAAAVAAAREAGATRGSLLEHVTSAEIQGDTDPSDFVGYASVVFA